MADQHLSMPFLLAIFVLYIFQIGLINAERNSTENDECKEVGDLSLDSFAGWHTEEKGVVLVCFNDGGTLKWRVICAGYNWDDVEAEVVCRQLGYGGSSKAIQNAQIEFTAYASVLKDVAMDNVNCIGNETRLLDCKYDSNFNFCPNLVGVKCNDQGYDGGGGFNNGFDNDRSDKFDNNTWDLGGGGGGSSSEPSRVPTVISILVIGVIVFTISGIVRCFKRSQQQARQQNHIPNATMETFQMVPPNHPSSYQVGQHPPPSSAFPNSQQMYPPKSQAGQMMPQSYPSPYPTGGPAQYPPPAGMMPPSQPNPYPTGGPAQYPPPAGMMPPSQPNPYPSGVQPYPPPAGMTSPSPPYIPSNEHTELPNCPPPSYDESVKSGNH